MARTVAEINEKIRKGKVVVVTAEEMIDIVREKGPAGAARVVDVVTTGTFGPMCSSGAFLNVGHSKPRIKMSRAWINDVPAYAGLAAVDVYLGATELPADDPGNRIYPGEFRYGGGHVITDLVAGKEVHLRAEGCPTDCYPAKSIDTWVRLADLNEAVLHNPRNAYQNYNCAVNLSDRVIYTYMGVLKPKLGNANFCSAGQLSPLMNDPTYRTIGLGTRIFLGGGTGYVTWCGTQHNPGVARKENGTPAVPAGTLTVTGDLKGMSPRWLTGVSFQGYGVSLAVGVGVPIPILDEDVARACGVSDRDIWAPVVDYGTGYPSGQGGNLGEVNYAQLRSGTVEVQGKKVPTASLSSYPRAREIAGLLKEWIRTGRFTLTEAVAPLPGPDSGHTCRPMKMKGRPEGGAPPPSA
jgi:uncharacterized protein (DUF39 family)